VSKEFPVSFNFRAFETISQTIDKINGSLDGLKKNSSTFNNQFKILQEKTSSWRDGLEKTGDSISGVGKKMSLFVTAPLTALAAKMVHTSVEAKETASKFDQVFKSVADGAKSGAIDKLKSGFDLSTQSAQEMLATTGLFAKDLGFGEKTALGMGEQVAALSVQIANFRGNGQSAEEMAKNLQMALLGNAKGLKSLGITFSDAEVKQEALAAAQRGARFETVEQAKAMAILSIIQKKTTDDQQDYAESSGEMANQTRVAGELFKELSKTIGDILKPAAERNLRIINKLQRAFLALSPSMQKVIVTFGTIAAAIGPVLVGLGFFVGKILPALITGFNVIASIGLATAATFAAVVAAVAAVAAIGYFLVKNWEAVKVFFAALWDGPLVRAIRFVTGLDALISIASLIIENWAPIKDFFKGLFDSVLSFMQPLLDGFKYILGGAAALGSKLLFGDKNPFAAPAAPGAQAGSVAAQSGGIQTQAQAIGQGIVREMRSTNDARVQIDMTGVPRGVKVNTQSTGIPPQLNLGMSGGSL